MEQVGNYKGVALGCSVFVRVLAWRLGRFAEDMILTEALRGFRSDGDVRISRG